MSQIKLGSHVGMAGKEMFLASMKEAESYGANILMLYTGAPQNTRRKEISELNIEAGWEYAKKAGIEEIIVHAPYIINLANTVKPETFELAVGFLEKEIKRTAAMQSKILVLHPGSALDAGAEAGIAQAVKGLNMVLDANDDDVVIALETMAGKGSEIGRTFEELKMIYDGVHRKDRLRVCFDTCHVNDAGYDLVNDYDGVFRKFDEILGLDQIAVFHINDSLNLLTMLIRSCLEVYVIAFCSLVSCDRICKYDLISVSNMRFVGCVGNRCCHIILSFIAHSLYLFP